MNTYTYIHVHGHYELSIKIFSLNVLLMPGLAASIDSSEAVNFITFSKQERLFYSKILFRCGYGNRIKKRLILAVMNKNKRIL